MQDAYSEAERREYEDLLPTSRGLLVGLLLGLSVILLRFWTPWSQTSTSLMWAIAWFAAGFLFGFLFGIPKVLQQSRTDASSSDTRYRLGVNTNLEEISDWLTKILVGATLTQLVKVPGAIKSAATFMSGGLGGSNSVPFAASLLLFFSAVGFFAGYVLTRMFFQRAFSRSDASSNALSVAIITGLKKTSVAIGSNVSHSQEAQNFAEQSRSVQISESLTSSAAVALATGAIIAGDVNRAVQASSLALSKSPNDARSHLNYAVALHEAKADPATVMQELQHARELITPQLDTLTRDDIVNSIVYLALYLPPPQGYTTAIESAEQCIRSDRPAHSSIWINLACAYGQKFRYRKEKVAGEEELLGIRNQALNAVRKAISADPAAKGRLRQVLYVAAAPEDDDLSSFSEDADFQNILGER